MPDPTVDLAAYELLFPTVDTGNLGMRRAGACVYNSTLEASGNTYTETQLIAIDEDPAGRKG